ncbi:MAG TPA: hypothetical protein VK608_07215 [Edaphobacter sp.]|nr:hypothetical protein [Edaphobacter sp.]
MRSKLWLCSVLAAAAFSAPAFGQVQIYIGTPPPPVRYEVRPPMPANGYMWTDGYWEPYRGRYRWMSGRWMRPPYPGAYWRPSRYQHYDQGWRVQRGYWDRRDGDHYRDHDHGHGHAYGHEKHGDRD